MFAKHSKYIICSLKIQPLETICTYQERAKVSPSIRTPCLGTTVLQRELRSAPHSLSHPQDTSSMPLSQQSTNAYSLRNKPEMTVIATEASW